MAEPQLCHPCGGPAQWPCGITWHLPFSGSGGPAADHPASFGASPPSAPVTSPRRAAGEAWPGPAGGGCTVSLDGAGGDSPACPVVLSPHVAPALFSGTDVGSGMSPGGVGGGQLVDCVAPASFWKQPLPSIPGMRPDPRPDEAADRRHSCGGWPPAAWTGGRWLGFLAIQAMWARIRGVRGSTAPLTALPRASQDLGVVVEPRLAPDGARTAAGPGPGPWRKRQELPDAWPGWSFFPN